MSLWMPVWFVISFYSPEEGNSFSLLGFYAVYIGTNYQSLLCKIPE
jgi:hypothetical protein